MNNAYKYWLMLMALTAGTLVAIGCSQFTENESSVKNATSTTEATMKEVSVVANTDAGSCGKCAAETAAVAAAKSEVGCADGCDACSEGDSANCKCGDDVSAQAANNDAANVTDTSNSHVNSMPEDRDLFHYLLQNHEEITRTVTELDNGVKTVTESTDPVITAMIQEHVASMYKRVEDGRPLRMWDELYREIFKHADRIKMDLENTDNGISVTETSDDDYVVKLIKAHAKVVTGFTERGFDEARQNHARPKN